MADVAYVLVVAGDFVLLALVLRGVGTAVTTFQAIQNVIGGLAALALIVYLFVALIRPEKF
jgi:K+-transporting ATPase KdpF subunit